MALIIGGARRGTTGVCRRCSSSYLVVLGKAFIHATVRTVSLMHGPHRATLIFYSVHVYSDRVGIIFTIPRNKRDALKDAPRRVPVMIDPSLIILFGLYMTDYFALLEL